MMKSMRCITPLVLLSRLSASNSLAVASASTATGGAGVHVPIGKDGDGEYTASTKGCFDVIDTATPLVLEQIKKQPLRAFGVAAYHIADYGTADAGTSLGLMTKMVEAVRERSSDETNDDGDEKKEVVIHYEDQLTNEWQSVFNHALGLKSVSDAYNQPIPNPYALDNVFVEACGVGFHNQCYPKNSIDFGVSFTAMHWLSCSPSSLGGTEYMHAARLSRPDAVLPEKVQAASDWKSILNARTKELAPGGRFVCVNFCKDSNGYFLGQTDVGTSMWDSFQSSWDELKEQGLIQEEERLGVSFPSYYRTKDEFLEEVSNDSDLKVVSIEERVVRCPYRELYIAGKTDKTPREYAEWFVPTTKTWSHSTFKSALNDTRSEEEKERIMDQFWENYMTLVEKNPKEHGMDYVHAYIVFEKVE